jgi:hypothetical protein
MDYSNDDYINDVNNFFNSRAAQHTIPKLRQSFIEELASKDSGDYTGMSAVKRKIEALDSLISEMRNIINTQSLEERNNERRKSIA